MSTVHARWLRLAWALAAFVPLAVISTPILAIRIGVVFLVCLMYLWPVTMVAHWLNVLDGEAPFGVWHIVLAALYCAAIGAAFAWVLSKVFRIGEHIERRRALVLISLVWIPIGAFATYQVFHYKGVFVSCAHSPPRI